MPYRWTEPEEVVNHNGVAVHHTYKDGGEYRSEYWYTLVQHDDDWEGESAFDIRELDSYDPDLPHDEVLIAAIEAGELKAVEE